MKKDVFLQRKTFFFVILFVTESVLMFFLSDLTYKARFCSQSVKVSTS